MSADWHVAWADVYAMVQQANRKQARRAMVGPVAMRLLRDAYASYADAPPPGVTETLMGLPIEEDEEIPPVGWQLHDRSGQVVHAGCFTIHHDDDCGEH
jgi:hypothetical protein